MELMFWKKKNRLQPCLVLTTDDRALERTFPVDGVYLIPKDVDNEAYLNSRSCMIPRRSDAVRTMIIDEREAAPLAFNKKSREAREKFKINDVANEFWHQSLYSRWKRLKGESTQKAVQMIALVGGCSTFGILIIVILATGNFHIALPGS